MVKPEAAARQQIDAALEAAGWDVQDAHAVNLAAGCGVAESVGFRGATPVQRPTARRH